MCPVCWFSLPCLLLVKREDVWEHRASGGISNHHDLTHNDHAIQSPDHNQESRDIPAAHQPAHGRCQDGLLIFIGKKRLMGNSYLLEEKNILWPINFPKDFSDSELLWAENICWNSLYMSFLLLSISGYE